ncbi:hypothetical protein [Dankookia sp. P2]|uniref:hypothetical protein n=1 Tax=Dankookia sp. P2 TaxID=3423955 RepID=UPI003D67462E
MLPQGWLSLPDRRLGGATIPLVLLHPRHGVVLAGGPPDGPALLRQRLAAGRFPAIFQGYLPVARTERPPADPAAALAGESPLSLPGGEAWVLAVCRALENEAPVGPPQRLGFRARRRRTRRRLALVLGGATALGLLLGFGLASLPPTPLSSPTVPLLAGLGRAVGGCRRRPGAASRGSHGGCAAGTGTLPAAGIPGPAGAGPPRPGAASPAVGGTPEPPLAAAVLAMPAPRPAPAETLIAHAGPSLAQPAAPAARCRLITQRMQIGETVAEADIHFLRQGCPG